jgi:hypothetical protein
MSCKYRRDPSSIQSRRGSIPSPAGQIECWIPDEIVGRIQGSASVSVSEAASKFFNRLSNLIVGVLISFCSCDPSLKPSSLMVLLLAAVASDFFLSLVDFRRKL